jgi:hypothetical protein
MSHKRIHRDGSRRRGVVAVFVSALMVVVLGILAIAMDGGLLRDSRRKAQAASDAAAMAAAAKLFVNYPAIVASHYWNHDPGGAAHTAAYASAAANGFTNDGDQSAVTVHVPPHSGPFWGRAGYAEVIVTRYQQRMFSRIWGSNPIPVTTRSVARGRWAGSGTGVLVLDPSAKSALNSSGTGRITVTGGAAVIVDSNNGAAAVVSGGGGISAASFEITGNYTGTLDGAVTTGTPPTPDPLAYLPDVPVPPLGQMTTENLGSGNKKYTLSPGRYTNLPNFNAGEEVVLQQASANSAGGVFYLDGCGLKSTGATITMDPNTSGGVMICNAPCGTAVSQGVEITGNSSGTVCLSALTSGPYAGILFWQSRTATQPVSISGNGNFSLLGTFYVPNATLQVTGGGNAIIGSQYISRCLNIGGNGNVTINYTDNGTARLREAILIE